MSNNKEGLIAVLGSAIFMKTLLHNIDISERSKYIHISKPEYILGSRFSSFILLHDWHLSYKHHELLLKYLKYRIVRPEIKTIQVPSIRSQIKHRFNKWFNKFKSKFKCQ